MSHSTFNAAPGLQLPTSSPTRSEDQTADDDDLHLHLHLHQSLLPGIPDHIAQLCLSHLPPSLLFSVSRSWRRLIYSPPFPPFLSLYTLLLPSQTHPHDQLSNTLRFSSFDPISRTWFSLPPPPSNSPAQFIFRHPSFISRKLPIQSVTAAGNLVLLAATNDQFMPALSNPLIFNPLSGDWSYGPRFTFPRRWCAAGASRGVIYVASGIGRNYSTYVARSVEKLDLNDFQDERRRDRWVTMGNLKDGKFSREAIDAVGWRGNLCMVNVKGDAAKEGIVYDVEADSWENMPEGMLAGWRGPAAAMEEETIYVVDESRGSLKKYDHVRDAWEDLVEDDMLKGAQHVAAARGKVCVVCGDGVRIAVVDVAEAAGGLCVVDVPDLFQVVAVHIMPRMGRRRSDFHEQIK